MGALDRRMMGRGSTRQEDDGDLKTIVLLRQWLRGMVTSSRALVCREVETQNCILSPRKALRFSRLGSCFRGTLSGGNERQGKNRILPPRKFLALLRL